MNGQDWNELQAKEFNPSRCVDNGEFDDLHKKASSFTPRQEKTLLETLFSEPTTF
jgi:hypothetical protein